MDSYLALVPRGFHHSVKESILEQLEDIGANVTVTFVGEAVQDELAYCSNVAVSLKKKTENGRNKQADIEQCCLLPVGSVLHDNSHANLGYLNEKQPIWMGDGELNGTVWVKIETDAPVHVLANDLRIVGPLIALVNVWEDAALIPSESLEEAILRVESLVKNKEYPFQLAIDLWHKHVKASWDLSEEKLSQIESKLLGEQPMKYRLSCVRSNSEAYQYTRLQFLSNVVDFIVPEKFEKAWKVDLTNYDLEGVVLLHPHALAVGITLRPYKQLRVKAFAGGSIPLDTSRPHLSREILSNTIRLRPSTAQILLHLAKLEPGDVVLDPCSGAGTIPMEVLLGKTSAVGLGGEIALTPDGLGSLAATYSQLAHATKRQKDKSDGSCVDQMAWDSTLMPLRDACVDVCVSDLPFGQQCLSRKKLDSILPLIVYEMARILRPKTGRIVLLCGSYYQAVLCLKQLNIAAENPSPSEDVICMPCESIFPVNIGGLLAWVVVARRGSASVRPFPDHATQVKTLTAKRERIARQRKAVPPGAGNKKRSILQT